MIRSAQAVTKVTPLASHGMVVAAHPLGAEVGAAVLKRGGNAVDAAVATAFAMTVAEPFMSTIAGGGTMLVHLAKRGETIALDFNVQAPVACHESVYPLEDELRVNLFTWRKVTSDANMYRHKSVAVPDSVARLALALERYGTID
jgi:gamma-glutamyltranspeptidase/glutathione hydrolase